MVPQLGGGRQHNYSTKTSQAGHANEQSMYSLMSMGVTIGSKYLACTLPSNSNFWPIFNEKVTF